MRAGSTPAPSRGGGAAFELQRFEWTADDRLEVVGRWFGVRGVRFIRPSLDLRCSDERRRLLALLEHKPWATEDGEEWTAAFACEGGPVEAADAELSVAPRITVDLPAPSARGRGARPRKRASKSPATGVKSSNGAQRARAGGGVRLPVSGIEQRDDRSRAQAKKLRGERDAATRDRDAALRERDATVRERDAVLRERDAALAERDAAVRRLEEAVHQNEESAKARAAMESTLAAITNERDEAAAAGSAERRAYETAVVERDRMRTSLEAALNERDAAAVACAQAERNRDAALRQRDAARRDREAARERADRAIQTATRPAPESPRQSESAPTLSRPEPALAPARDREPDAFDAPTVQAPGRRLSLPPRLLAIGALAIIIFVAVALLLGLI